MATASHGNVVLRRHAEQALQKRVEGIRRAMTAVVGEH